jgi:ATP-dependent DNA helicase RecG
MARKKYRYGSRYEPHNERSLQEYVFNVPQPQTSRQELIRLIRGGEDTYLELKVRLSNVERIAQEICAMANTDGGTIVFGVDDYLRVVGVDAPDVVRDELARICREEIQPPLLPLIEMFSFDTGRSVVALEIEPRKKPYRTRDGRFFLRFGAEKREATREELSVWLEEIRPLGFENLPVVGANEKDIDDMILWTFARHFAGDAFDENQIPANYAVGEFLKRDLLLAVNSGSSSEEFVPTAAAVLLFGKNESVKRLIPRSSVTLTRCCCCAAEGSATAAAATNEQIVEQIQASGNLIALFEKSLKFIERYADLWTREPKKNSINGSQAAPFKARSKYARATILEALTNLLTHRDLSVRDISTRISVFDDAIEFVNPRRTNGFVPPAKQAIRYGVPQRLNPQTQAIFKSEAYGAEIARGGLPMILRESRLFAGKRAEVYTSNDEFRLKIFSR